MKLNNFFLLLLLIFLPNCLLRKSSRPYDCARAAYENVLYRYERDIGFFEAMQKAINREEKLHLAHELKDEILLKNEEYNDERCGWFGKKQEAANYPFTQYKLNLDCSIKLLESAKSKLYWKQEGLAKDAQDLINTLDRIRKYIVLDEEYGRERHMMERRKILEIEKKELKKEQRKKKQVNK